MPAEHTIILKTIKKSLLWLVSFYFTCSLKPVVPLLNNLSYLWLQYSSTVIDAIGIGLYSVQWHRSQCGHLKWWKYDVQTRIYWMHSHTCDVEEQETVLQCQHPSEYRHAISICNISWKKDLGWRTAVHSGKKRRMTVLWRRRTFLLSTK